MTKSAQAWKGKKLVGIVAFAMAAVMMCGGVAQAQDKEDFSGFYVGAVAGYADGSYKSSVSADVDHEPQGASIGVQAGWGLPVGPCVLGIDADIAWSFIDGEDSLAAGYGYQADVEHDVNYLSTVRAKVGGVFGPVLVYVTAGLAMADLDNSMVVSQAGLEVGRDDASSFHIGWTCGAGAEVAIAKNISVMAEYLWIDMGEEEISMNIGGYPFTDEGDLDLNVVRVGANYRF